MAGEAPVRGPLAAGPPGPGPAGAAARLLITSAVSIGAASGFVEALVRLGRGVDVSLGAHLAWMPAIANAAIFAALAVALLPVVARWPRIATPPRIVGLFGSLAAWDVVVTFSPPLAGYAVVVLSLGLGVTFARLAARSPVGSHRGVRLGLFLVGIALFNGVAIQIARSVAERRAVAAAVPPSGAPNVLLLLLDTVRAASLSTYGYLRPTTPTLTALADSGTRFENAYATAPWTLPSHGSFFTGRWAHELSADWRVPLDRTHPTLAEALADHGYATGGFVANLEYGQRYYGLARGFAHYADYRITARQVIHSSHLGGWLLNRWQREVRPLPGPHGVRYHRNSAEGINRQLLDWLDARADRPFFAFVNYFDAHFRYYTPPGFPSLPKPSADGDPADVAPGPSEGGRDRYDHAIAYLDREIGRLLAELGRRNLLENTLIVVASDHGEQFRENGVPRHGNSLFRSVLHVPLILALPGRVPAGRTVTAPVSLRDLPTTVLDLAGLANARGLAGRTLSRHWTSPGASIDTLFAEVPRGINLPPVFPVSRGDMRSVVAGNRHLIVGGDGAVELYDLALDPWEQRNVEKDPAYAADRAALVASLTRLPAWAGRRPPK